MENRISARIKSGRISCRHQRRATARYFSTFTELGHRSRTPVHSVVNPQQNVMVGRVTPCAPSAVRRIRLSAGTAAGAGKPYAGEGYDPQFGARLIKRAIQEQILNPLSLRLFE